MNINKTQVHDYLDSLLGIGSAVSTTVLKTQQKIDEFIFSRLTSKKFRKTKLDENCAVRTKRAIVTKLEQGLSLKVVYPQGGYKLWRLPSSPTVDWAEFFNISYLIEYLLPIAHNYQPGVELVYYMHTLLMEKHDNLSTTEIDQYVSSFQQLLDRFSAYLPKNFSITILKDADIYSRDDYFSKLEEGKAKAKIEYLDWPKDKKDRYERMANLNIKWQGNEDWSVLSAKNKQEKIQEAAYYEASAVSNLQKVMEKVKSPNNILVFTISTPDFIGIGSTRTSVAKYWVGYGVLEKNKGKLQPRVLSPSQYQQMLLLPQESYEIDLIEGKNFKEIVVLDESFSLINSKKV